MEPGKPVRGGYTEGLGWISRKGGWALNGLPREWSQLQPAKSSAAFGKALRHSVRLSVQSQGWDLMILGGSFQLRIFQDTDSKEETSQLSLCCWELPWSLGLGLSQHLHKELPVVEEDKGRDAGLSFIIAAAEGPLNGIPHLGEERSLQ